jgi:sugar/nucleoside kinase (ribokinase family)
MAMEVEILCLGHASYDLSVLVDGFPAENSKCETQDLMESGGGPAANAAYLLAKWDARCAFAGVVGDDAYGQRAKAELESVGADVSRMELREGHVTPVSLIWINRKNGSRTIANRKANGAPLKFEPGEMKPRVLLFDGHELEASLAALQAFPNAISILDAGSWREGTARLAEEVDYLVASERFAMQATGLAHLSEDEMRRACVEDLRARYRTTVVVTLGEEGLIADDGDGYFYEPAYVAPVVDTTAAGDIFHGAFAYAILQDKPLLDALSLASMTASLSVRKPGGRVSIPTLDAVKEALAHAG